MAQHGKQFKLGVRTFDANCTGQECRDRDNCLRYLRPASELGQVWASFDLERKAKEGDCPALEPVSHGMRTAMRKAGVH